MSNYPTSIDGPSSLFSPVDAFSTKPLQTTTSASVGAGDVSISVVNANLGFASTYGVISIDDEIVVYATKTGTAFNGCIRGAFGTTAATHSSGAQVNADMVAGFITSLQSAVVALETAVGVAGAFNFIGSTVSQTVTGVFTFQNGIQLGSAPIATTGMVSLPNASFIAWRNAANTADITVAVGSNNHLQVPIVDFNGSQTFPGSGTVTSVALSMPGVFSVSGSPITASGTLTVTLATQTANTVWAGPTSGSAAAPTFRALVALDLGTGTANNKTFLRGDLTFAGAVGGGYILDSIVSGSVPGGGFGNAIKVTDSSGALIGYAILYATYV